MEDSKRKGDAKDWPVAYSGDFISKSNILISGKYKSSLQTNRITYLNNLKLQTGNYITDPETQELVVRLYPSEIVKMTNVKNSGSVYQSLQEVARQMLGTFIGVTDDENERFRYLNLVTESVYEDGVLETRYNPHMKKYLLNLEEKFTKLPRDLMMSWRSTATYRLYELMKQHAYYPKNYKGIKNGVFRVTYDVYELRLLLGVVNANLEAVRKILDGTYPPDYKKACEASPEKTYVDWTSFRRRVIDTAVVEINGNDHSDIKIEYATLKKKHGEVYAVEFTIYLKDMYKKNDDNTTNVSASVDRDGEAKMNLSQVDAFVIQVEVMNILENYKINLSDIISICEAAGYDVEKIKKAESVLRKQVNIDNVVGWLISAIKNSYEEPVSYKGKSKNQFLDFEQREDLDWAELEKDLLDN